MMTSLTLEPPVQAMLGALSDIYERRAYGQYGLTLLNQRMHAVQGAALAKQQGLPETLVVAVLLHDLGHMVHGLGDHPAASGIDDRHEEVAAQWLAAYFGPDVREPIRLHVAAKRYLCAVEPDYQQRLSTDSIESLALQGGPMTAAEVAAFEALPYGPQAVALRRIDDAAKDPHGPLPSFDSFYPDLVLAMQRSPGLGQAQPGDSEA